MNRLTNSTAGNIEPITVVRIMDRLNIGGPALHAVLTTRGLDPQKFRTVLVIGEVEPGEGDMNYLLARYDVKNVISIPSLGRELRPLRDLWTLVRLVQVLRREKPHLVHTHKAKAGALGRIAALLCGVPVRVHTFHGHVLSGYFGPRKSQIFAALERGLAKLSAALVVPSAAVAQELADTFHVAPPTKFRVVPLGFDLDEFAGCQIHQGELKAELGLNHDTKLVGIVGRMVAIKDHATFIAAAAQVAAQRPDTHFVFVGAGELEGHVRSELARLGLLHRAHLLGWRADMPQIFADLDVLALSSRNEGTPVAIIEALAAGVPVVATRVGGVADVLREGARGCLVAPGDAEALARGILQALDTPCGEAVQDARTAALAEYGAQRLCHDLEDLYSNLLEHLQSPTRVLPDKLHSA